MTVGTVTVGAVAVVAAAVVVAAAAGGFGAVAGVGAAAGVGAVAAGVAAGVAGVAAGVVGAGTAWIACVVGLLTEGTVMPLAKLAPPKYPQLSAPFASLPQIHLVLRQHTLPTLVW